MLIIRLAAKAPCLHGRLTSNVGAHANTMRTHESSAMCSHCKVAAVTARREALARRHARNALEFSRTVELCSAALAFRCTALGHESGSSAGIAARKACSGRPSNGGRLAVDGPKRNARTSIPALLRRTVASWSKHAKYIPPTFHLASGTSAPQPFGRSDLHRLGPRCTQVIVTLRGPIRFWPAHLKR